MTKIHFHYTTQLALSKGQLLSLSVAFGIKYNSIFLAELIEMVLR